MANQRKKGNPVPLIAEEHPEDYQGYPFITLIQYGDDPLLSIVDNTTNKTIKAFILDLCGPEGIDEQQVVDVAATWYHYNYEQFPVSFEFSRHNLTNTVSPIYKTLNIEFVTRVIGPLFQYEMKKTSNVRRRKRKTVPSGVVVNDKTKNNTNT